ncbi:hypothetical protein MMC24_006915 [Lignoscripta atroalba]|nr:hypothetical protein [Lignoscripta atroalba]
MTQRTPGASILLDLSPKLRLKVLDSLLVSSDPIDDPVAWERSPFSIAKGTSAGGLDPTILRACSSLYEDGWPRIYRRNHFRFTNVIRARAWLKSNVFYKYHREVQHLIFVLKGEMGWLETIFRPPFRGFQRLQTVVLDISRLPTENHVEAVELSESIKNWVDLKRGRIHEAGVMIKITGSRGE